MKFRIRCLAGFLAAAMAVVPFGNLNVYAKNTVVDTFYVLDEEGNPEIIEITQEDLDSFALEDRASLYNIEEMDEEATEDIIGIVRFKRDASTFNYVEADSGRSCYLSPMTTGEAAFIGFEGEDVVCYVSGTKIIVDMEDVAEIVSYKDQDICTYYTANGYLVHRYTYYSGDGTTPKLSTTYVGLAPSYLTEGVHYYSYDGHFFYETFEKMIEDYKNDTRVNSVNPNTPHYNYYQYLSFHTTAVYTGEEYDKHVEDKKGEDSGSAMLKTGNEFLGTQNTYIINALMMYGIAINESGWGMSNLAIEKNNLFGLNAVDSNPYEEGKAFSSTKACIEDFAYGWIHSGYLSGTDSRYRGPHLGDKHSGINVMYASDPYWGEKAASRPYYFDSSNKDYGRFTIGIAKKGEISLYKEADSKSKVIYTSEAGSGGDLYDYPVMILDTVVGTNDERFYKVISDMSLLDDRSARNVKEPFKPSRDYVYAKESDIQVVFEGNGKNTTIPDPEIIPVFPDVDPDRYSYDAIEWAFNKGVTTGSNGLFKPFDKCTREEVVTFLWRSVDKPAADSAEAPFPDVKDNYALEAIAWAAENGITTGSQGYFRPENNCTREEVVTFMWRTAGKPQAENDEIPFPDVKDNYAVEAIKWAAENGITTGTNGKFRPEDNCTREEVVTFIYRAFGK